MSDLKEKIERKIEEAEKAKDFERASKLRGILNGLDKNIPRDIEEFFSI